MTTPMMTGKRMPLKASFVVSILRNPDMSKVIRRPPISPRGGNVYVFCIDNNANREAWKNDNIHFHHDGTRGQPKTNPIVRKVFFCAMTGDGRWTRDFMKHVYTLYHNPNNFVVIHYLGDESIARDVPRHRKPRSNTKKHTTCTSTAIQVDPSELSPLSCGSDQQDEDEQVIEDGVHDSDNDGFGVQVELGEPMVEIDIEDDDSVIGRHGMYISCNYEHDFHSDGNKSQVSSAAPLPSTSTPYQGIGFMEAIPLPSFDDVPMSNPLGLLSEVTHLSCRPIENPSRYSPGEAAESFRSSKPFHVNYLGPSEPSTSYEHLGTTASRGGVSATVTAPRESEPSSVIPKKRLAMRLEGQDSELSELLVPSQPSLFHIQPSGLLPKKRRLDFEEPTPGPSSAADSFCDPVEDPGDSNDTGQSNGSGTISGIPDAQDSTLVISELTSSSSSTPRLRTSARDGFQHSVNSLVQNVQNLQTMLGNPEMWEHNPETRDAATEPLDHPTSFESFITSLISSGQLAQIVAKVMQLAVNWKQRPGAFNSRFNACMTLICQVQSCWPADMEAARTRLLGNLRVSSVSDCDVKNYINLVTACVVGVYRTRVPLGMFLMTLSAWPGHLEESDSRSEVEVETDLRCVVGRTLLTGVQLGTLEKMEPVDEQVVRAYMHLLANHWTSCLTGHCLVLPSSVQRMWEAGRYSECRLIKPPATQSGSGKVAVMIQQLRGQLEGWCQPTPLQQGSRGDTAPPGVAGGGSSHAAGDSACEPSENVKKFKNFLCTLLKLASCRPPETAESVRELVQDLIDGNVQPELFVEKLRELLDSSPQPYLIPFIKKFLSSLRECLSRNKLRIEGVRAPPIAVQQHPEQVQGTSSGISHNVVGAQQDTLSGYTWIFLPYRVSDSHWALLVVNMPERSVSVINPDQQQYPHIGAEIIQHWRKYTECVSGLAGEGQSGWREEQRPVFNQTDPSSSGVHLLMAAEAILCGTAPVVMRTCHVRRYRQYVLSRLLSAANFDFEESDLSELVDNDLDFEREGTAEGENDECLVPKKGVLCPKVISPTMATSTSTSSSTSTSAASGVCTAMPSCSHAIDSADSARESRVRGDKRAYSSATEVSDQDQAIDFSRSHNSLLDQLLHDFSDTINSNDQGYHSACPPKEHSYANRQSSTQSSGSAASQEDQKSTQTNSTCTGNVSCTIPSYKATGYSFQQVSSLSPRQPPRYPTRVESLYPTPRAFSRVSSTAVQEKPCDMSMQSQLALDSQPSTSSQLYLQDAETGGDDLRVSNAFRCYDLPTYSVSESEGSTYTELSNVRPCDLQTGSLISSTLSATHNDKGQGRKEMVHLLSPSAESNSSETINVDSLSPNSEPPGTEQLVGDSPAGPPASGSGEASSSGRLSPVPSTSRAGLEHQGSTSAGRDQEERDGEGEGQDLPQDQSNLQMLSTVAAEDAS